MVCGDLFEQVRLWFCHCCLSMLSGGDKDPMSHPCVPWESLNSFHSPVCVLRRLLILQHRPMHLQMGCRNKKQHFNYLHSFLLKISSVYCVSCSVLKVEKNKIRTKFLPSKHTELREVVKNSQWLGQMRYSVSTVWNRYHRAQRKDWRSFSWVVRVWLRDTPERR